METHGEGDRMRRANRLLTILSVCIVTFIFSPDSSALEKQTHKAINEHIARHTILGFSLDAYVKNQLGFLKGVNEIFLGSSENPEVWGWVEYGGKKEDEPLGRSFNHFHDPLEMWDSGAAFQKTTPSRLGR